ncbi:MAG: 30S ribosomal protein S8 [Actinomycetota bacterium]|nr:30S ribosomal protein S8 [Actinomycetota bacterium]
MAVTDPVADMLTRIRNAGNAKLDRVDMPYSKLKLDIATILEQEGYIKSKETRQSETGMEEIRIYLKYDKDRRCAITGLKRISKPGLRNYAKRREIPKVRGGLGTVVLSTSKGVMTDQQAKKEGLGGEVLCFIW